MASGLRLCRFTNSSEQTTTMLAPSLIEELLPAVTVPSFLKAAFNFANFSKDVSDRGPSSLSTIVEPFLFSRFKGRISFLNSPRV